MPNSDSSELKNLYRVAIINGDSDKAKNIIDAAIGTGYSLKKIYDEIIYSAHCEITNDLSNSAISVADQHLATNISKDQLGRLRESIQPKNKHFKKVVVASLPSCQNRVAARVLADFFLMDGWDVHYLGVDVPGKDLAEFVNTRSPNILCISISDATSENDVISVVKDLKDKCKNTEIIVGGGCKDKLGNIEELKGFLITGNSNTIVKEARLRLGMLEAAESLEDILLNIAQAIRGYRKNNKVSQKELAERAGLDRAYMNSIEKGKKNITFGSLLKISGALGLSLSELLRISKL
jgi:methanogenic corrinoid protein MtbC1/DNA-binding Xre family transcriptional regulator